MKLTLILAVVALSTPCLAAAVELPVKVTDGSAWTIETTRTRVTEADGRSNEISSQSRSRAVFRQGRDGGVLTLEPIEGSASADLPPELRAAGLDFPLQIEVDDSLTPTRMRNWPQLRDATLRFLAGQSSDAQARQAVETLYRELSDEDAPGLFTPHLAYVALGQGLALEVGKPQSYEDEVPNPLGGPPIRTRGTMALESHDRAGGRAVAVWTQALDPESMAASISQIAKRLFPNTPAAAEADTAVRSMKFDREERCRFEIDTRTGLATRTECSSTITVASQGRQTRRTDRWTITQTLPGPR